MLVITEISGGKSRPVEALAFHPDGRRLAVAGGKKTWTVFRDATTGAELARWPAYMTRIPHNIAFHPSGQWLFAASGDRGLYVVDVKSGFISEHQPAVYSIAVAPNGERVVVRSIRDGIASFRVSEKALPVSEWTRDIDGHVGWRSQWLAFFPDGEQFASAEYRNGLHGPDTRIRIRSAKDGSVIDKIGPDCGFPDQVAVSPDGVWVALRAAASLLIFHQTDAGKSVKLTSPNRKHLTGIAFHPGARYLAATSNDATVRLHDRDAGWEVTRTFDWNIGKLKSVAFSPDGNLAAAGSETGKVVVWDVDV